MEMLPHGYCYEPIVEWVDYSYIIMEQRGSMLLNMRWITPPAECRNMDVDEIALEREEGATVIAR